MLFSTYNKESLFSIIVFLTCTLIEIFPCWAEWRTGGFNGKDQKFKHENSQVFGLFLFCQMQWKGDKQMICHEVTEHLSLANVRSENYLNGKDHVLVYDMIKFTDNLINVISYGLVSAN